MCKEEKAGTHLESQPVTLHAARGRLLKRTYAVNRARYHDVVRSVKFLRADSVGLRVVQGFEVGNQVQGQRPPIRKWKHFARCCTWCTSSPSTSPLP